MDSARRGAYKGTHACLHARSHTNTRLRTRLRMRSHTRSLTHLRSPPSPTHAQCSVQHSEVCSTMQCAAQHGVSHRMRPDPSLPSMPTPTSSSPSRISSSASLNLTRLASFWISAIIGSARGHWEREQGLVKLCGDRQHARAWQA